MPQAISMQRLRAGRTGDTAVISKHRIMIVDDQRSVRALVRSNLIQMGFRDFIECEDGEEALKRLPDRQVSLIISDLNMPKLHGLGLLHAIRNRPGYESTPFILLIANGDESAVNRAIELKVDNYVVKPFTFDALKQKVERGIGSVRQN